jgi:hypothetical protein
MDRVSQNVVEGGDMKLGMLRIGATLIGIAGILLFFVFAAGQLDTQQAVSLEDIYALLVTEDGENRLDLIEAQLAELDVKVDLIYLQTKEMMEEEGWQFEKQQWTLDDIKFLLDIITAELNTVQDKLDAMAP